MNKENLKQKSDEAYSHESSKHVKVRAQYHEVVFDHDLIEYLNASKIKSLYKQEGVRKESAAMDIGTKVHDLLYSIAKGNEYPVVIQERFGSQKYKKQKEELEARYGEEGAYALVTPSNAEILNHAKKVGLKFLSTCRGATLYPEYVLFISSDTIEQFDESKLPASLRGLHQWVKATGLGVKAAVDLLVKPLVSQRMFLYDYKRTSKTTISSILKQFQALNYPFSLMFYRYVLALQGIETSPIVSFLALNPLFDTVIPIEIDTDDQNIVDKFLSPVISTPYTTMKTNTLSLYTGAPIQANLNKFGWLTHEKGE